MSNRTLVYLIAIVLVAAAAGFLWRRVSQNQTGGSLGNQTPASLPPQTEGGQSGEEDSVACERKFDAQKLKTAEVEIADRRAEIAVRDYGGIILEFFPKDAPKTVENFLRLANAGYFDCLTFHRVAKGFVIQGGDPTGTGGGGESAFGGEFADEINPASALYEAGYKRGVVAMANRGPDTNTSQFFILLSDASLPPGYTIFGKVVSGFETVDKIGRVDVVPQIGPTDGAPKIPVIMESVRIK